MRIFRRDWAVTTQVPEWLDQLLIREAETESVQPGNVACRLLRVSSSDKAILTFLTPYFLRPFGRAEGLLGSATIRSRNPMDLLTVAQRYTLVDRRIPLARKQWFEIDAMAYALCLSIEHTASILLITSLFHPSILRQVFHAVDFSPPYYLHGLLASWHSTGL
jgi:hypothetical protein